MVWNCASNEYVFDVFSVNKRLDEWVTEEYLDTRKVQFPRKDGTTTGHNTGVSTPKRFISNSTGPVGVNSTSSRPTSPKAENDSDLVNGNTVMAAAIQKKMNRKRKVSIKCAEKGKPFDSNHATIATDGLSRFR